MVINPGRSGQLLYGIYYDVRDVFGNLGFLDTQETFIEITNTSPASPLSLSYNPNGGVVFRIRLRESLTGLLSTNVDGVVGCGQTWVGRVFLGEEGVPHFRSPSPVVTAGTLSSATITTQVVLDDPGGQPLQFPNTRTPDDVQRGTIEVIAEEALRCQPDDSPISAAGQTWTRLGTDLLSPLRTPANVLSGEVTVVQPLRGVGYSAPLVTVSRYLAPEAGSVFAPPGTGLPALTDCVIPDNSFPGGLSFFGGLCVDQANLALSRSRYLVPFKATIDGKEHTRLVVAMPTIFHVCPAAGSMQIFNGVPHPPFQCSPNGESITATVTSDLGVSRKPKTKKIKRAVTVFGIGPVADPLADVWIKTGTLESGHIDLDLTMDAAGTVSHGQSGLNPDVTDFLGAGLQGYRGLPALALVLQESQGPVADTPLGSTIDPPFEVSHIE
jgi:hypothetical protein